jgi:hypothetical protein
MFFQDFFGVFENDYTNIADLKQYATIYVSKNEIYNGYVGNENLAVGDNPWSTDNSLSIWVIVGICCGGLALVMIAACIMICCCRKGKEENAQDVVYAEDRSSQEKLVQERPEYNVQNED